MCLDDVGEATRRLSDLRLPRRETSGEARPELAAPAIGTIGDRLELGEHRVLEACEGSISGLELPTDPRDPAEGDGRTVQNTARDRQPVRQHRSERLDDEADGITDRSLDRVEDSLYDVPES